MGTLGTFDLFNDQPFATWRGNRPWNPQLPTSIENAVAFKTQFSMGANWTCTYQHLCLLHNYSNQAYSPGGTVDADLSFHDRNSLSKRRWMADIPSPDRLGLATEVSMCPKTLALVSHQLWVMMAPP